MKRIFILLLLACASQAGFAQSDDDFDGWGDFNEFAKSVYDDFEEFKNSVMKEYIDFVRNPWKEFEGAPPTPAPKEEPLPPVVIPEEEKVAPIEDKPVPIDVVIPKVEPEPQPQPVEPIKEVPATFVESVKFTFFGTEAKVRFALSDKVELYSIKPNDVADALEEMSSETHNNMLIDCLALRDELRLSDWGYLQMITALSHAVYGKDLNSAALLTAYIYMQSGYKMRLAVDSKRLYMLYGSEHYIYEQPSYLIDGCRYYSTEKLPMRLQICPIAFQKEKSLSLILRNNQQLGYTPAKKHRITAVGYPDFSVEVAVNKNNLDFYSTLPTSMIGDNSLTRWAMYANTPFDERVSNALYPAIKRQLDGMTEVEAATRLLNFVQTGFKYEYDDKVWGGDRIFFPDECVHYSYNDCDDRSVLFSRLVRDLLGLDVALVFVPGHVLVAVNFKSHINGNYMMIEGRKFVLCEPTCTNGAPLGWSNVKPDDKLSVIMLDNNHKVREHRVSLRK